MTHRDTSPSRAKTGDTPTQSVPAISDIGENSASTLIESPQGKKKDPWVAHEFADGGGGGGAEAYRVDQAGRGRPGK